MIVEICANGIRSALTAQIAGADRIELCSALSEGGLTPSYGLLKQVCCQLTIPVHVLIRPRNGDFLYNDDEFLIMQEDIAMAKQLNAQGIVTGILTQDGQIDTERMKILMAISHPLSVTFHRAFDMTCNPYNALEQIIGLGCQRILTSGQAVSATEGTTLLQKLTEQAAGRIIIMAGGGISGDNIESIATKTGIKEFHASATSPVESKMKYRQIQVSMSGTADVSEYICRETSEEKVRRMKERIKE